MYKGSSIKKLVILMTLLFLITGLFTACNKSEIKIDFVVDEEVYHTITTKGNLEIQLPSEPQKDGHVFDGWFFDNNIWENKLSESSLLDTPIKENTIVYAKWTPQIAYYTVTFNGNGGLLVTGDETQSVAHNTGAAAPIYSKEGYILSWDKTFTNIVGDITVNAVWTQKTYTVIFNGNGGLLVTGDETQNVAHDNGAVAPVYSKEGYNLSWDKTFTNIVGDITVNAVWTQKTYTVTFNGNGGLLVSGDENQVVAHGIGAVAPVYSKEGYILSWDKTFTNIVGEITVNAVWSPISYTITFDSNGGNSVNEIVQDFGTPLSAPTAPEKDGFTFGGWYTDNDTFNNLYNFNTMPKDLILYAKWMPYLRVNAQNEIDADGEYILIGEYPQTIKEDGVTVSDNMDERGYFLGDDGYYYSSVKARPFRDKYTFSTGETVASNIVYYFKVETIKWRLLSLESGKALILCESILNNSRYDENSNNYLESDIRQWLNNEFYQSAFSELQQELIEITELENNAKSTGYATNPNACENTLDNVFLLSYMDATNSYYGLALANNSVRMKQASDYSRASGVSYSSSGEASWMSRSPDNNNLTDIRSITGSGAITLSGINGNHMGIVPAITIKLS